MVNAQSASRTGAQQLLWRRGRKKEDGGSVKTSSLAITTSVTPGNSSHGMPIFSFGGEGGTGGQLVDLVSSVLN
jgi:hypothetical protein